MPKVRIYQPAKNAMQSGRGRTRHWLVEFEPESAPRPDALMGWSGHGDTRRQLRLRFASRDDAVAYAEKHRLDYQVETPRARRVRPKSYAENFRFGRLGNWTH